jgi:hypothetical protein
MRFLSSKYSACPDHPNESREGDNNGDITCLVCGQVIGRWNLPWSPRWVLELEDAMGRSVAGWVPRSIVKYALVRATAYATGGRWHTVGASLAPEITALEVSRRWEIL